MGNRWLLDEDNQIIYFMRPYETMSVGGIDRRSTLGHFKCHENERGEEHDSVTRDNTWW